MRNTKLDVVVVGLVLFITIASSPPMPAPQDSQPSPSRPAEAPRASAGASTTATVRIINAVTLQDGKASEQGVRSRSKVQNAAGEWQDIEVINLP